MPTAAAALAYARIGWPVFPCRGKIPCERGSHGVNDATADLGRISYWWRRYPGANIGLAAGHVFFALDVDGHEGEESLFALMDRFGPLPDTLTQFTGGGGAHLLFKAVPGLRNWAGRFCIDGEMVHVPGLDVRTMGAAIIAAPSMHKSGKLYHWKPGHGPKAMIEGKIELAAAPEWLVKIATPLPEPVVQFPARTQATPADLAQYSRYVTAALEKAAAAVKSAPPGSQEGTLHREAFAIGGLVSGYGLDEGIAFETLAHAAHQMEQGNPRWPWTARAISEKIRHSMHAGINRPRFPQPRGA